MFCKKNWKAEKKAFSMLEFAIAIFLITIIISGILSSSIILSKAKLAKARSQTQNSPIKNMENVEFWFETTSARSFDEEIIEDSSFTENSGVEIWYDSNPNPQRRRNAFSISASHPKYFTNCISHLPCLRFNGANSMQVNPEGIGNSNYTIFVVEQRRSGFENPFLGTSTPQMNNTSISIGYYDNNQIFLAQGSQAHNAYYFSAAIDAYNNPVARLHTFVNSTLQSNSANVLHFLDGSATASGISTFATLGELTNYTDLVIGRNNQDSLSYYEGDFGEIIFISKALNQEERKSIENYLLTKWKIKKFTD